MLPQGFSDFPVLQGGKKGQFSAKMSQNALQHPCRTKPYCIVLYAVSCIIGHSAQPQFGKVLYNPLKLINAS